MDLSTTSVELVNGIPLHLCGELLVESSKDPIKQATFVQELRQYFNTVNMTRSPHVICLQLYEDGHERFYTAQ